MCRQTYFYPVDTEIQQMKRQPRTPCYETSAIPTSGTLLQGRRLLQNSLSLLCLECWVTLSTLPREILITSKSFSMFEDGDWISVACLSRRHDSMPLRAGAIQTGTAGSRLHILLLVQLEVDPLRVRSLSGTSSLPLALYITGGLLDPIIHDREERSCPESQGAVPGRKGFLVGNF